MRRWAAGSGGVASSVVIAAVIVAGGVIAGVVVGGALRSTASLHASPTPTAEATEQPGRPPPSSTPIDVRTATPRPSPTPVVTPAPTIAIPTPGQAGPDGIPPPLARIDLSGGDAAVASALDAAIDALADPRAYRFRTNLSGRSLVDLSSGGVDLGTDGSLVTGPVRSLDLVVGFRMVEFECSAATSSSSRYVIIGEEAWSQEDGVLVPVPGGASTGIIDEITPQGLARRILAPFAAGYELVGPEAHEGVAATRYRATAIGLDAYAAATGIVGDWMADAWVADSGVLLAVRIEGSGPGPCDGFLGEISVRDIDDPAIVIARPS